MKSLWKLKPYLRPHLKLLVIGALLAIPLAAVRFSPIPLIQKLIDELLKSQDRSKLVTFPLLILGIYALNFVIRFFHNYCVRVAVAKVNQTVKNKLYDHVMSLSADYFTAQSTGTLMSRVGVDTNQIDQGISQINVLIREPFQLLFLLGYTFYVNWKLTLVTLVIFPLLAIVFSKSSKALKRYVHRINEQQAEIFSILQESFVGIRIIKTFRLEAYVQKKYYERSEIFTKNLIKTAILEETSHPAVEFISAIAIAFLVYFGGKEVLDGHMTSGQLIGFFGAFAYMQSPIRDLNGMNMKLSTAAAACERVMDLFSWKSNLIEKENPAPKKTFDSKISLEDVRFAYPDAKDREVLRGVSFDLQKGKTVALVGASGAGKSSLVNLLPRLFDVTGGAIKIDGRDIRDLSLADLRSLISVVSQDVFLFNDTIEENIRCGKLGATEEEIRRAAREAHADDFISKAPDGYQSRIGDRGQKLSGGERQRLSIARAFLRESPILILDEATSALDNASEKAVQSALEKLMQNRTTIVIAHRLSTIRHADEILVMKNGQIIERGTHDSLASRSGEYAHFLKMAEHQGAHT